MKKYPQVLQFAYYEAVMAAEDDFNFTPKQVLLRYQLAAKKLKLLLLRTRGASLPLRKSLKNEYYWFSKQPYKQYLLGVKEEKLGARLGGYYSQGVGAAQVVVSSKRHVYLREEIKSKNMAKRICATLSPKYFCTSFCLT